MKRVLITGGDGYIASAVRKELSHVYNITSVSRKDFDLTDSAAVSSWLGDKHFDVVLHTAIVGGSRLKPDDVKVVDDNLRMYYNLLDNKKSFDRFISIGSGAELYHSNTPYGLSKHVIRQSMLSKENFYNVRVFAVFDENELDTRFIKANILRYIKKEPMRIDSNKQMSFFYMKDFVKVIDYYFSSTAPEKEFNCVYENSPYLLEVAHKINNLSDYAVEVHTKLPPAVFGYVGTYTPTGIEFIGLEKGIQTVYNILKG